MVFNKPCIVSQFYWCLDIFEKDQIEQIYTRLYNSCLLSSFKKYSMCDKISALIFKIFISLSLI